MPARSLLAATAMFTLSLAACSGPPEDVVFPDAEEAQVAAGPAAAVGDPAAVPVAGATEAVPTPGVTPTPGASTAATPTTAASTAAAARPAAAPAPAVAAGPPAAFATCGICHSVAPGQNMVGPSLAGVVGRRAGTAAGANYTPAMRSATVTWNEGTLDRYLADPAAVVPGTAMPAPGLDAAGRRAVIAYLKTL